MTNQSASDFAAELEKEAEDFESRAQFWESNEASVIGMQVEVAPGVLKDISGRELSARLRALAKEWRQIANHVRQRGLRIP